MSGNRIVDTTILLVYRYKVKGKKVFGGGYSVSLVVAFAEGRGSFCHVELERKRESPLVLIEVESRLVVSFRL